MTCCFGSRAAAERREKAEEVVNELQDEQASLKNEAAQIKRAIEEEEASKGRFDQELKTENAHLTQIYARSEASANEMHEIRDRVSRKHVEGSSPARSAHARSSVDDPESGSTAPAALAEAWREAEKLMCEIARMSAEVKTYHNKSNGKDVTPLGNAEAAAASLRAEIAEARQSLAESEEEGKRLEDEHQKLQTEEEPLQEWVEHVERELRLARTENSELTKAVNAASRDRSDLQRDELDAFPHGAASASQAYWLQEQEQENIARKAVLLEEISARRMRRDQYLEQVASCRKVVAREFQAQITHQSPKLSPLPQPPKLPQRHLIASPSVQMPANRADHMALCTGSQDKQRQTDIWLQPMAFPPKSDHSALTTDNQNKQTKKEESLQPRTLILETGKDSKPRTISPSRPVPRVHTRILPITENIPLLPYYEESEPPLLSSPTHLFNMLASTHGGSPVDLHISRELSNEYDSNDESESSDHLGYWTAVAE